jgi:hypothetical protein
VPHRGEYRKGSFSSHFDDLIAQFPAEPSARETSEASDRSRDLQEKIDLHARLFERAWRMDRES